MFSGFSWKTGLYAGVYGTGTVVRDFYVDVTGGPARRLRCRTRAWAPTSPTFGCGRCTKLTCDYFRLTFDSLFARLFPSSGRLSQCSVLIVPSSISLFSFCDRLFESGVRLRESCVQLLSSCVRLFPSSVNVRLFSSCVRLLESRARLFPSSVRLFVRSTLSMLYSTMFVLWSTLWVLCSTLSIVP